MHVRSRTWLHVSPTRVRLRNGPPLDALHVGTRWRVRRRHRSVRGAPRWCRPQSTPALDLSARAPADPRATAPPDPTGHPYMCRTHHKKPRRRTHHTNHGAAPTPWRSTDTVAQHRHHGAAPTPWRRTNHTKHGAAPATRSMAPHRPHEAWRRTDHPTEITRLTPPVGG